MQINKLFDRGENSKTFKNILSRFDFIYNSKIKSKF